jgi:ABC-type multidrug transport system ATPase subunit/ABC-type multidrug transport system permease subunit
MGRVIELIEASVRVGGDVIALRDVSLSIERGDLVAIIGASGVGKTTLLDTMCGLRTPFEGEVRRAGAAQLGYVPQDDIVHLTLPLRRSLRYTAALRNVDGDSVGSALRVLELADRADVRVGSLSGGQRKRASIAAELLGEPSVFFLDEPTSGLDPARGAELMRTLRRLVRDGATVVLTTHNPLDAERCDKVAVLGEGGYLVFSGTPEEARVHFGVATLGEVYEALAGPDPAHTWAERFTSSPFFRTAGTVPDDEPAVSTPAASAQAARAPGPLRQWALLTRRNADILVRSRLTLAILIGSPLMVLAMFLVLFRPNAFDPAHQNPETAVMIIFWVAFGGFFFGLTYGLLQICSEFPVLRRERLAGLRAGSYVLAKASVLLPLLAAVDLVFLLVLRALGRLPAAGNYGAMFVTLLLSSAAALGLGLLISAAVSEPSQATIALPMVCFPQVLFVGAILPVPVMAAVGRWISYAMTNRWAFEALGHSLGVNRLWASGASALGPPLLASYGDTFSRAVAVDWVILAGFAAASLVATMAVVVRKTRAV